MVDVTSIFYVSYWHYYYMYFIKRLCVDLIAIAVSRRPLLRVAQRSEQQQLIAKWLKTVNVRLTNYRRTFVNRLDGLGLTVGTGLGLAGCRDWVWPGWL